MKKIILLLLANIFAINLSYSQPKDTLYLANPRIVGGMFCLDLKAGIPAGRTWRVGSSNIRVDFYTQNPTGKLVVHPDGTVQNALSCINSGSYSPLTTTLINGGTAISFNITRLAACCYLTTGTYTLGTLRWDTTGPGVLSSSTVFCDTIRGSGPGASPVYDSLKLLTHGCSLDTCWQHRNFGSPPQCQVVITGISGNISSIPTVFKLHDNYPNPFNPATTIKYDLPKNSFVKIVIYDLLGKEVTKLVNEKKSAGSYEVQWDASNYASGTYFYKMETSTYTEIKKMVLVK